MRKAINRLRKYKDKITGFDGLEVYHTGYKHSKNVAVERYASRAAFFALCDFLASQLCIENRLGAVECARVFQFMRKCCGETYETGRACYDVLKECKWRFPGWVKCDEIAAISNILNRYLGCSYHYSIFLRAEVEVGAGTAEVLKGVSCESIYLEKLGFANLSKKETSNSVRQIYSALSQVESSAEAKTEFSALSLKENSIYVKVIITL